MPNERTSTDALAQLDRTERHPPETGACETSYQMVTDRPWGRSNFTLPRASRHLKGEKHSQPIARYSTLCWGSRPRLTGAGSPNPKARYQYTQNEPAQNAKLQKDPGQPPKIWTCGAPNCDGHDPAAWERYRAGQHTIPTSGRENGSQRENRSQSNRARARSCRPKTVDPRNVMKLDANLSKPCPSPDMVRGS